MWADPGKYALIGAAAQLGEKLCVLFSSSSVAFTNEMSSNVVTRCHLQVAS